MESMKSELKSGSKIVRIDYALLKQDKENHSILLLMQLRSLGVSSFLNQKKENQ